MEIAYCTKETLRRLRGHRLHRGGNQLPYYFVEKLPALMKFPVMPFSVDKRRRTVRCTVTVDEQGSYRTVDFPRDVFDGLPRAEISA